MYRLIVWFSALIVVIIILVAWPMKDKPAVPMVDVLGAAAGHDQKQKDTALHFLNSNMFQDAAPWFKKAALAGDIDASFRLGKLYYEGKLGKGKAKEVCPCGVLTKSKKPCKKNGLPEFGGKCKQHKDEQAPARVVSVETTVVEEASTSKHEEEYELSDEDAKILKEMKHYEENDEEDMEDYEEIDEIEFDNYEMN